jgi:hypothetical protein
MKQNIFYYLFIIYIFIGGSYSCTNLDEVIYSQIPADKFFNSEQDVVMSAGRAYAWMRWQTHLWGAFTVITNSADEACTPYRDGGQWYNNKEWVNLHLHDFKTNDGQIYNTYNFCYQGISLCNQVLYQIGSSTVEFESKDRIIAEIKILRAYLYYCATNWFGDVPIQTDFTDLTLPAQKTRRDVCDFILNEIDENIDLLYEEPNSSNYGRCTQAMANVLRAKIFLNYEKWFGETKWDSVISACDAVINKNHYMLEPNYFTNFQIRNEVSRENIFVVPFDPNDGGRDSFQFTMYCYSLHPNSSQTFGFPAINWNGICALEDFYNSYDELDLRKKSWLEGPQYTNDGKPILNMYGTHLNYKPHINGIWVDNPAKDDDGVRCNKWEYGSEIGVNYNMDNDYAIYRYADVLMMKAEALMRKNGGLANQEAVDLVNQVRSRAFGNNSSNYSIITLTMDELLDELGREFAWEMHRRDDLIRFNKWTQPWWEKEAKGSYVEVYPIPSRIISVNPNIKQTPGYVY